MENGVIVSTQTGQVKEGVLGCQSGRKRRSPGPLSSRFAAGGQPFPGASALFESAVRRARSQTTTNPGRFVDRCLVLNRLDAAGDAAAIAGDFEGSPKMVTLVAVLCASKITVKS